MNEKLMLENQVVLMSSFAIDVNSKYLRDQLRLQIERSNARIAEIDADVRRREAHDGAA